MVNYGDSEFRQWAEENNYDEQDLNLIKSTCKKRMLIYFLFFGGAWTIMPVFSTLFYKEWVQYKIIKQGTFNPRAGLICSIQALCHFLSFIFIIPIFFNAMINNGKFLSITYLQKKGFIGEGNVGRVRYEQYKKIKRVPHIIRVVVSLIIAGIMYFLVGKNDVAAGVTIALVAFYFIDLFGCIFTTIIDNIKYKKWLNS